MDNLHNRQIFDARKNLSKEAKFQNLVEKYCKVSKMLPYKVCKFPLIIRKCEKIAKPYLPCFTTFRHHILNFYHF
jgi:hypothetical protein